MASLTQHQGHNTNLLHSEQKVAKYVFISSEKGNQIWKEHDHSRYDVASLSDHLRIWHKDQGAFDLPALDEEHGADHSMKVAVGENFASYIDVNPLAIPLFEDAKVVFIGIEGSLKNDAMLSAVLSSGISASVCSFAAVWLWNNAPGLEEFVRTILAGKILVIVPDADWIENPKVENAARTFKARLMSYGAEHVLVAAPPTGEDRKPLPILNPDGSVKTKNGKIERAKGVDDYLGAGGTLGELTVTDYQPCDKAQVVAFLLENAHFAEGTNRAAKAAGIENAANALVSMSLYACKSTEDWDAGTLSLPMKTMETLLGLKRLGHSSVSSALRLLQQVGAIEIDGEYEDHRGIVWKNVNDLDKPIITIAAQYRAVEMRTVSLSEHLPFVLNRA